MKKIKNKIGKIIGAGLVAVITLCATWMPSGNVFAADPVSCVFDAEGYRVCDVDLSNFGYGKFVLSARGEGESGNPDTDIRTFYYYPAWAELVKVDDQFYLDVHYNWDNGSETPTGDVASIQIKVYYPGSDQEVPFSPITVPLNESGYSRVELPFEAYGLEEGDYKVEVYAYDRNGELLSPPYVFMAEYTIGGGGSTPVPDTGNVFQGTNVSKTDFLITGLAVFGVVAVAGVIFIVRSDKRAARRNTRSARNSRSLKRRK